MDENGDVASIDDFMNGTPWIHPHDATFGPDGSLYVVDYGNGFFNAAPDAGLYRIDYVGDDGGGEEPPPACLDQVVEDFEGDALDREAWPRIVRENPDGYSVADGSLMVETAVGDMIRDITTAQNRVLRPLPEEGAWQATTEFTVDTADPWQQAGLIVYGDDQDFIKVPVMHGGATDRVMEFLLHVDGQLQRRPDDVYVLRNAPDTIHLRLTSDGSRLSTEYSLDGEDWVSYGGGSVSLDGIQDPHIGFFAARGPDEGPVTDAAFHSFDLGTEGEVRGPNDDFEGDALDRCIWPRIVREDPDGYSVADGSLMLETGVGDMIREHTDAPNLILQPLPDTPWVATTEMTLDAADPWQQGGLIVYGDDQNFIKAPMAYGGGDARRVEFILQSDGVARTTDMDWAALPTDAPDTIQLRLTSDGSAVSSEYSLDGEQWTSFGRPAPLAGMDDPHIGFFAARGPDPGPVTDAAFHSFTLEAGDEPEPPTCPEEEEQPPAGWRSLFDGETLDGWSQAGPGGFEVTACGTLEESGGMGLSWYDAETFGDFRLRVDWKTVAATENSGVFLRFPDPGEDPWVAVDEGYEIQIDDSQTAPTSRTGSVYTFAPADPLASNPPGEWNTFIIEVIGQEYVVELNGVEVSRYTGDGSRGLEGFIGLQNHLSSASAASSSATSGSRTWTTIPIRARSRSSRRPGGAACSTARRSTAGPRRGRAASR